MPLGNIVTAERSFIVNVSSAGMEVYLILTLVMLQYFCIVKCIFL